MSDDVIFQKRYQNEARNEFASIIFSDKEHSRFSKAKPYKIFDHQIGLTINRHK